MKRNRFFISLLTLTLLVFSLSACQDTSKNNIQTAVVDDTKVEVDTANLHLGFGLSTYVSPLDASSVEEGKLQDGRFYADTALAVLLINGDNRIVYAYFDDVENDIWFDEKGSIYTDENLEEWPSNRVLDNDFVKQVQIIEEALINKNHDEAIAYLKELKAEDYSALELNELIISLENAFLRQYPLSSVQNVGVNILDKFTLRSADDLTDGSIAISTTIAVLTSSENGDVTLALVDEVETSVNFSNQGKVLNSRFDTRSQMAKSETMANENKNDVPPYFAQEVSKLQSIIDEMKFEDIVNIEVDDERFAGFKIPLANYLESFKRASQSMIAWY